MPITTTYSGLLPILNERCTTFPGPSWWLDNNLQFRSISEEEVRLVIENSPVGFQHRIEAGQKALLFTGLRSGPHTSDLQNNHRDEIHTIALSSQVAFNLVGGNEPLILPYGVIISEAYRIKLRSVEEFDIWGDALELRKRRYRIAQNISGPEIRQLFTLTRFAAGSNNDLKVPFSRFYSALLKTNMQDRIIDLTIALESLVPGGGEFRFRFPFFLSLLITSEPAERREIFQVLRDLYDARSALVHGSSDRQRVIDQATDNWQAHLRYAKQCILYRIQFENEQPCIQWKDHLEQLAFGVTTNLLGS